jgi:hypothetical protein
MTPKDKAKELFKKYSKGKDEHGWNLCEFDSCAKKCALIVVDEILLTLNEDIKDLDVVGNVLLDLIKYCQEVKQEIELL